MRIPNYAARPAKDGTQATGNKFSGKLRSRPEQESARTTTRAIDILLALAAVLGAVTILSLPLASLTW
jgi:hypothetical protein